MERSHSGWRDGQRGKKLGLTRTPFAAVSLPQQQMPTSSPCAQSLAPHTLCWQSPMSPSLPRHLTLASHTMSRPPPLFRMAVPPRWNPSILHTCSPVISAKPRLHTEPHSSSNLTSNRHPEASQSTILMVSVPAPGHMYLPAVQLPANPSGPSTPLCPSTPAGPAIPAHITTHQIYSKHAVALSKAVRQ